jgi:hypothetical protein
MNLIHADIAAKEEDANKANITHGAAICISTMTPERRAWNQWGQTHCCPTYELKEARPSAFC